MSNINLAITALGAACTALLMLIGWLFLDTRNELRKAVRTNGKHLDSVIVTIWGLVWRVNSIEDWLKDEMGYRPPRTMERDTIDGN
jgi:hypothetical protein